MKVAVYTVTRDRLEFTRKSLRALRKWAGCEVDLWVADNGSRTDMVEFLLAEKAAGNIRQVHLNYENLGQNIAANALLDEIMDRDYRWVLRWDNDAMPRSRRFLRKMVRIGERLMDRGGLPVLSPRISKLKYPPPTVAEAQLGDKTIEVVDILGGICRLHPAVLFQDFRFSKYAPMGFGEADEMAGFCKGAGVPMLRLPHLEVEHLHGHDKQAEMLPEEHTWERREVPRYVSYGL